MILERVRSGGQTGADEAALAAAKAFGDRGWGHAIPAPNWTHSGG